MVAIFLHCRSALITCHRGAAAVRLALAGVFPQRLPAIATSEVVGIVMWLVFSVLKPQPVTGPARS
jgi:hypothetical protein